MYKRFKTDIQGRYSRPIENLKKVTFLFKTDLKILLLYNLTAIACRMHMIACLKFTDYMNYNERCIHFLRTVADPTHYKSHARCHYTKAMVPSKPDA